MRFCIKIAFNNPDVLPFCCIVFVKLSAMKNYALKLIALLLSFCLTPLTGQEYRKGAILDGDRYGQTDAEPERLILDLTNLPRSISLKQYSPVPGNQGDYDTCVGWATAYAALTISESLALNRTNREQTQNNAFSPIYVYKNISKDPTGLSSSRIPDALDLMKNSGIVKRLPLENKMTFEEIDLSIYGAARRFPISGFVQLYSNPRNEPGAISERVPPVKMGLVEGKPIIIGMNTPDSFFSAKHVWRPEESPANYYGGHAMCVVGYDDDMHGGAFEVQNSWGTAWGNGGYAWITYSDFAAFVYSAYEITENLDVCEGLTAAPQPSANLAKAKEHYEKGDIFRKRGDWDLAILEYSEAIRLNPHYAAAYHYRGYIYDDKGDFDSAIADYNIAIRLKPDNAVIYHNRGYAYCNSGEFDRAIADYNAAIRLKPDYALAFHNRGNAYYYKSDFDRAIADYNMAIKLKPDDAVIYYNRSNAHRQKGNRAQADADYAKARELGWDSVV